jgi:hypothetical protein
MQRKMLESVRRAGHLPIHPFLGAAYAVVLLYTQNLRELIPPEDAVLPLVVALIGTAAVFGAWWAILRRIRVAALATTLLVALFFGYGYAWEAIAEHEIGHAAPLLTAWLTVAVGGLLLIRLFRARAVSATPLLNVVLGGLLIVNLGAIALFTVQIRAAAEPGRATTDRRVCHEEQRPGPRQADEPERHRAGGHHRQEDRRIEEEVVVGGGRQGGHHVVEVDRLTGDEVATGGQIDLEVVQEEDLEPLPDVDVGLDPGDVDHDPHGDRLGRDDRPSAEAPSPFQPDQRTGEQGRPEEDSGHNHL